MSTHPRLKPSALLMGDLDFYLTSIPERSQRADKPREGRALYVLVYVLTNAFVIILTLGVIRNNKITKQLGHLNMYDLTDQS